MNVRISASTSVPFGPTYGTNADFSTNRDETDYIAVCYIGKVFTYLLTKGGEKDIKVVLARGKSGGEVEPNPPRTAKSVHAPVTIVA